MKLLHTADWHLGATLGRHDRTPDHQAALRALIAVAEAERPELIVHAGDLFHASRPHYPALQLGIDALQRLAAIAPTVVVRGNHDSGALFDVLDQMAGMASPRRLWFVTRPCVLATGVSDDAPNSHMRPLPELGGDPVALACVPFIAPGAITDYATGDAARFEGDYADGIRTLNDRVIGLAREAAGPTGIVLYTAHLHVDGARFGTSERRLTVGEDHATHTKGLHRALYSAFGHIHDPQQLPGSARGRYAGSLIPLDFGEAGQSKQAVVVTIGDDVQVAERELPPGRPLVGFQGTLAELKARLGQCEERTAQGEPSGYFLKAAVTSDDPIPDLADRVTAWSPGCVIFNLVNEVANRRWTPIDTNSVEAEGGEPAIDELFAKWRESAATERAKKAPLDAVVALFREAVGGAGDEEGPDFGVTALSMRAEAVMRALRGGQGRQA